MRIPAHVRWPAVIGGALALHAVAWIAVAWLATSDPSYAVEEDYYRKAVEWDASRRQASANDALGWSLDLEVTPLLADGRATLRIALADRDGAPLDGAAVHLEAFHNARADRIFRAALSAEGPPGWYACDLPMRRDGLWELRLDVEHGADRFTWRDTRHLVLGGGR